MKIEQAIGARLRRERMQQGMTLEQVGDEMATYLGKPWTAQAVWQAEQGKRDFRAAQLLAFALVFEIPLVQLLASIPPDDASLTIDDYELSTDDVAHLFPLAGDPAIARELIDIEYRMEKAGFAMRQHAEEMFGRVQADRRTFNEIGFDVVDAARDLLHLVAVPARSPKVKARYEEARKRLEAEGKLAAATREHYKEEDGKK